MVNSLILVGKIVNDPEIKEAANGKNVCEVTLALRRPFKNMNNVYDTDFIKVTFWEYLAININEYCKKGATIAVKGRLQVRKANIADKQIEMIEVVGEQLIFIGKPLPKTEDKNESVIDEVEDIKL